MHEHLEDQESDLTSVRNNQRGMTKEIHLLSSFPTWRMATNLIIVGIPKHVSFVD
jgi:hypothetical protein